MKKFGILSPMRLLTAVYLLLFDIWTVRSWKRRWGTPIDKGNRPARIPIDYRTQSNFSREYQITRELDL